MFKWETSIINGWECGDPLKFVSAFFSLLPYHPFPGFQQKWVIIEFNKYYDIMWLKKCLLFSNLLNFSLFLVLLSITFFLLSFNILISSQWLFLLHSLPCSVFFTLAYFLPLSFLKGESVCLTITYTQNIENWDLQWQCFWCISYIIPVNTRCYWTTKNNYVRMVFNICLINGYNNTLK